MKVVAVFDIDNDCIFDYSCDLCVWNEFGDVRFVKEAVSLKPLPQKRNDCYYYGELAKNEFAVGFNACLDEIVGDPE